MQFADPTTPTITELEALMKRNGGSLYLRGTGITSLPEGLTVGGSLYLRGTGVEIIYTDTDRGYELRRIACGDDEWWVAGCRLFRSRGEALAHWGGHNYPDTVRGAAYCRAINETPDGWQNRAPLEAGQ